MSTYRKISPGEVDGLTQDITDAVEHRTGHGQSRLLDYDTLLSDLETTWGADLGTSYDDPTVKAILAIARRVHRELRAENGG